MFSLFASVTTFSSALLISDLGRFSRVRRVFSLAVMNGFLSCLMSSSALFPILVEGLMRAESLCVIRQMRPFAWSLFLSLLECWAWPMMG